MGSSMQNFLMTLLTIAGGITVFVLVLVFIAVPVFKGVGAGIGAVFSGIGWLVSHLFGFVFGVLGDLLRFIGSLLAMAVFLPMVPLNIIIGRWSAAAHYSTMFKNELPIAAGCVYRAVIRRPLRLVLLDGLLEGLEQRVPEAMAAAPASDKPSRRAGQFDGYTIIGSLKAGGSGAKLYVATPSDDKRRKSRHMGDRVVIKAFALTEGSSLPQIVRESRALECARQMGLVLDHGMDDHRFFYVMPYHPGDHLGILTRQMHAECGGRGLDSRRMRRAMNYAADLLRTLACYHQGGLWHKDVKPENVIVHDGRAHLVDLGLVTPLRSAMTLTTHGTEYFRDPEMVRQALRGVKVHQVDGAKFDVYAVGAVLYFMIENTFPAHGGLSRFAAPAPEALRWIVRRAMAEYHQRYVTAEDMLADVEHVARADDAMAVKPADLPSMRGQSATAEQPELVASAKTPAEEIVGFAGGIGAAGPFAQVGRIQLDEHGQPIPRRASSFNKPKLTVTNWWTGAYRAAGAACAACGYGLDAHDHKCPACGSPTGSSDSAQARTFREHAFAFRRQADDIGRQAKAGAVSARRAAREQLRAARQRARDIRSRAAVHRRQVRPGMRSGRLALGIGTICLLAVFAGLFVLFFAFNQRAARRVDTVATAMRPSLPLLVVVDSNEELSDRARREIARVLNRFDDEPYSLIAGESGLGRMYAPLVREWRANPHGEADAQLESLLARMNAYGILEVLVERGSSRQPHVSSRIIYSTAPDADQRGAIAALAHVPSDPPPARPYLLLNDHPAKSDPRVEAAISQILNAYSMRGWSITTNDDAEVSVRKYLPAGPINERTSLSPMLDQVLHEAGLGGVLRLTARQGDGPAHERIEVTLVDGNDGLSAQTPESPPANREHDLIPANPTEAMPPQSAARDGKPIATIEAKPGASETCVSVNLGW